MKSNIDWKRKLGSRKFWACLAGFLTSIGVICGLKDASLQQMVGVITAFGSLAVYMLSEAKADAGNKKIEINKDTTSDTEEIE